MRVVVLIVCVLAGSAAANGRFPATASITFRQGNPQDIHAGMTFGSLISHDGGTSWRWMCEAAIGYGGMYDPDYAYSSSGALFATTFDGVHVNHDGCTYQPSALATTFVSSLELAPTGALHACAADPADAKIYTSTDDGVTFPTSANPGMNNDWWDSIVVAPSDAQRVYLAGYRIVGGNKTFLMFTSADGGATFTPMTTSGMTTSSNSAIQIVGVAPSTPTTLYAKVTLEDGNANDGIYKSVDTGTNWTRIAGGAGPLAFAARANGQLVVGNRTFVQVSNDGGTVFTKLTSPPRINCLAERANGELWACTDWVQDGFGIMKSTDLSAWTGVLDYKDIAGPVACPIGTTQRDSCCQQWPFLRTQLGITAPDPGCGSAPPADASPDAPTPDAPVAPPDAGIKPAANGGCCQTGSLPSSPILLALAVAWLLRRRASQRG